MKKLQDEFSKWNKSYIFLNSKLKSCSQNWFLKSYLLLNWNEHDVFKAGKVIHLTLDIHNMRWQRVIRNNNVQVNHISMKYY